MELGDETEAGCWAAGQAKACGAQGQLKHSHSQIAALTDPLLLTSLGASGSADVSQKVKTLAGKIIKPLWAEETRRTAEIGRLMHPSLRVAETELVFTPISGHPIETLF